MNESGLLPFKLQWKPTLLDSVSIRKLFNEANEDQECAGVITWMHIFFSGKIRDFGPSRV